MHEVVLSGRCSQHPKDEWSGQKPYLALCWLPLQLQAQEVLQLPLQWLKRGENLLQEPDLRHS